MVLNCLKMTTLLFIVIISAISYHDWPAGPIKVKRQTVLWCMYGARGTQ